VTSELTPVTQEHIKILDQFPKNLSLPQAHLYIQTIYQPQLENLIYVYDQKPQYPHINPRFSFAVAKLYLDVQNRHYRIVSDDYPQTRKNIDYFCQYCGNLITSPFENGFVCNLVLRRNEVIKIRKRLLLPATID